MHKSKKVLVVDDCAEWLQALTLRLEGAGYLPVGAPSGDAAMNWAIELGNKLSLIILDVHLQEGKWDGYKLCKALKYNLKTRKVPVVLVTGNVDPADLQVEASRVHAELSFNKSIGSAKLVEAIDKFFNTPRPNKRNALELEGLKIDSVNEVIAWQGMTVSGLSQGLFDLFYLLADRYPDVLPAREILVALRRTHCGEGDVRTMISRLRKGLEEGGFGSYDFVETIHNEGYRLQVPVLRQS